MPDHSTITISDPRRDLEGRRKEGLDVGERARIAVLCLYMAQDCQAGTDVSIATQPDLHWANASGG